MAHLREETITSTEVASHWHEHFGSEVSDSDKILNDQAVCFFQVAQGADLGTLTIGRKGNPTRFDFDIDAIQAFVIEPSEKLDSEVPMLEEPESEAPASADYPDGSDAQDSSNRMDVTIPEGNRVFITHGRNHKILGQVKELVSYGKLEPVVAMEHETAAKPVPKKVMDDMRTCKAAVIHVSAEKVLYSEHGDIVSQINDNVLIEIGAAMALYGDKFVLLVEEGLELPSNLQGLYECRYSGEELSMPAAMKLLKAFSEF